VVGTQRIAVAPGVLIAHVIDLVLLNALMTVKGHRPRFVQTAISDMLVALPFAGFVHVVLSFIGPLPNPVTPDNCASGTCPAHACRALDVLVAGRSHPHTIAGA
jgi:hypothetical protein